MDLFKGWGNSPKKTKGYKKSNGGRLPFAVYDSLTDDAKKYFAKKRRKSSKLKKEKAKLNSLATLIAKKIKVTRKPRKRVVRRKRRTSYRY